LKEFLDTFDKGMDEITRYSIELFGDYTAAAGFSCSAHHLQLTLFA
jgi:hypothetical protein